MVPVLRHGPVALALLLAALPGRYAQAQLLNGDPGQPIEIQADSGIEWRQDEQLYIARGNAVAKRGPSEVHADTLIAHYRPIKPGSAPSNGSANAIGGNTEIYRVDAEGNVTINRDNQTVVGDQAVYDVDQALAVITGKALKLTTATDTVTARDSLEWYDQKQIAVGRGDAVAIRNNGRKIRADVLTAYMDKTAPPPAAKAPVKPAAAGGATPPTQDSKITRIDGQGHVVVTNAIETGRGDYAVYNAVKGVSTLIGNVVITRGKDVMRGQAAVMDMNKNVSRILPAADIAGAEVKPSQPQRVQGLFLKEEATGNKSKSDAKPDAAKPDPAKADTAKAAPGAAAKPQ
ncbi:MAG TPA: LptA/OstA family protein [Stellaceae bacterium]|jgi:lipopolysaccharide export system protein LptA|nr:LptA/OstA family protein [Stellaceae bacterium]